MRGTVTGLGTPYPLRGFLPAVLQEDEFVGRWTAGLDDVLAPVVSTLDCLTAYLDPVTAPADFLDWLAGWFGVVLDENLPLSRRRALVAAALGLYQARGTLAGLRTQLELVSGGRVEIEDSGGVGSAQAPNSVLPGSDVPTLTVRVALPADTAQVSERTLHDLIQADKPAHVAHRLEVTRW
jgi:phage tail-like protein